MTVGMSILQPWEISLTVRPFRFCMSRLFGFKMWVALVLRVFSSAVVIENFCCTTYQLTISSQLGVVKLP